MKTEIFRPIVDKLVKVGVDRETAGAAVKNFVHRSYRAKERIFSQGDALPDLIYLLSGYVKLYSVNEEGDQTISIFAGQYDFVGCIQAILYNRPAHYTAECITDCQIVVINHHEQGLIKQNQRTQLFLQDIIVRHLYALMEEKTALLPLKATERYLYFRERHPEFTENIPAGLIANYLGVRPQSLSRIKQNLK